MFQTKCVPSEQGAVVPVQVGEAYTVLVSSVAVILFCLATVSTTWLRVCSKVENVFICLSYVLESNLLIRDRFLLLGSFFRSRDGFVVLCVIFIHCGGCNLYQRGQSLVAVCRAQNMYSPGITRNVSCCPSG